LSNTEFKYLYFKNSLMKSSKATGAGFEEGLLKELRIQKCKFDFTCFRMAHISDTVFENCDLNNSDFRKARLANVVFLNCDLSETDFSGADFKNIDLRHSVLLNTKIDLKNYSKITISPSQAVFIAGGLGFNIEN
jgi:fluoroquinolone resistance protein